MDCPRFQATDLKPCLTSSCKREGCAIRFAGTSSSQRKIIDCDKCEHLFAEEPTKRRPDFLIFYQEGQQCTVAIVEAKSGRPRVSDAVSQIKAGARVAAKLLGNAKIDRLLPILVCGSRIGRADTKTLSKYPIQVKGVTTQVRVAHCGVQFRDLLNRTWYR